MLVRERLRPTPRKCTGKHFPREVFSISGAPAPILMPKEKPPFRAVFLLFLYFLEDLTLSGGLVELLELELALHLLLVLAGEEDVS